MNNDLKIIKRKFGEKMSHLCAILFPTLLEQDGLLSKLLLDKFDCNRYLYQDIVDNNLEEDFKNFIYSLVDVENVNEIVVNKSPIELMDEAGYILRECHTEEEIQSYRKYYANGEALCTFGQNRLNRCRVFFAVKKNVDEIKRENFKNPIRQDEYGTSVISIQFTKDSSNTLSIKNRYNHRVNNPDATFSNNLDNIIPGLTHSFATYYGLTQVNKGRGFEIPGYVRANDGKYYKFNYEKNNIYYCADNIIIDNYKVCEYDKSRCLLIDNFIIDLENKTIKLYDDTLYDGFLDFIGNINKISIKNVDIGKIITIELEGDKLLEIYIDQFGRIIKLNSQNNKFIGSNFLNLNNTLTEINLFGTEIIGDNFLNSNITLSKINVSNVKVIGNNFLSKNQGVREFEADNLVQVGNKFLPSPSLNRINMPKLKQVGNDCLLYCQIDEIDLPSLEIIGDRFLYYNETINNVNMDNLEIVGNDFMYSNNALTEVEFKKLRQIGNSFMFKNDVLREFSAENLEQVRDNFMQFNIVLSKLNVPNLKVIGNNFLYSNNVLIELDLERLSQIGNSFMFMNSSLKKFSAKNLSVIGDDFLYFNNSLLAFDVSNLEKVGDDCLFSNNVLEKLNTPKLSCVGTWFLGRNNNLRQEKKIDNKELASIYMATRTRKYISDDNIKSGDRRR